MSSSFQTFNNLHQQAGILVLPNCWDAKSASVFQEKQYQAVATSSMAVANSLGYDDGENMPFNDYLFVVKRILSAVQIPLSVDMETGYGASDAAIYDNLRQLIDLGVTGINIEDSIIHTSGRTLKEAKAFAKTIEFVKNKLTSQGLHLFMNIRCDTFLLNVENKQRETRQRLMLYEAAGADGIFLPCISREEDIAEAVHHTRLPLNVMCIPGLPGFETLQQLGVKRLSMGSFLFNKAYSYVGQLCEAITADKSFSPILS